jgi:hypothetical protein
MKKYIKVTVVMLALILLATTSCKKNFIEITPKTLSVARTFNDYNSLMNASALYVVGGTTYGIWEPAALMGDEVSAEAYAYNLTSGGFIAARGFFQWQADIFSPTPITNDTQSYNPSVFFQMFTLFYTLNKVITEVPGVTDASAQQIAELQAEAKAERAFFNFQLVNYFTKPYNASTASTDLGFPIITVPDVQANSFPRGTVQQSYDFMINDLTQAIPDLSIQPSAPTRMSKAGAEAMLAKIYLSMNRYTDALTQINNAFIDMAKMGTQPVLYNYNITLAPGGAWSTISGTTGPASSPFTNVTDTKESLWAVFTHAGPYNNTSYSNNFLTIQGTASAQPLFDQPTDWRLKFYSPFESGSTTIPIPTTVANSRLHRYNLLYARVGIELPDMYLMRAELEARTSALGAAVTDVTTLRSNRMPTAVAGVPTATQTNQTALIQFIIAERTREFAATGARWFDMRRLSNDPLFPNVATATHTLYHNDGVVTVIAGVPTVTTPETFTTFTLTPARLTLRLPPYFLSQNPGMADNP